MHKLYRCISGWQYRLVFKPFTLAALKGALEDAALRRTPSDHWQAIHRLVWAAPLPWQNLTRPARIIRPQAKGGGLRLSAQGTAKAQ